MNNYEWIFFDADNTLFDFDRAEHNAIKSVLTDLGISYDDHYFQAYKTINKAIWTAYENGELPKGRLRAIRFERFFAKFNIQADASTTSRDYLQYLSESAHLLEGAEDLLLHLSKHYRLALVTNGLKEVQRPRFEKSGVQHLFKLIVVSDEIGVAKPERGFFDFAFQQIGSPHPEKVIIIGDNLNSDIRGGFQYGLDTCWFNPNGYHNDTTVQPKYTIKKLQELPILLSNGVNRNQ